MDSRGCGADEDARLRQPPRDASCVTVSDIVVDPSPTRNAIRLQSTQSRLIVYRIAEYFKALFFCNLCPFRIDEGLREGRKAAQAQR
jgi:hypothetical protein